MISGQAQIVVPVTHRENILAAATDTEHSQYINTGPEIDKDVLAAEVRVEQSVKHQRSMPVLILGNALGVVIVGYLNWSAAVSSNAIFFLTAEVALLIPMVGSYLKLRNKPRPKSVSKRHIHIIEIYSILLGLMWCFATIQIAPLLNGNDGAVLIMTLFFLSYGAAAVMPSMPFASTGYLTPLMFAIFIATYIADIFRLDVIALIGIIGSAAMVQTIWQNWQDLLATVRFGLEKLQVEADSHQQLAVKEAQLRLAMDNMPSGMVLDDSDGNYVLFNSR